MRVVQGLRNARLLPGRPGVIPVGRPRAVAKKLGLAYEREVARHLVPLGAWHGLWFEYWDQLGRGFCQPDLLWPLAGGLAVLEVKYTWTELANRQLLQLYLPVVERALGLPTRGIQVCKRLLPEAAMGTICLELDEALTATGASLPPVLHWIGTGPGLVPRQPRPATSPLAVLPAPSN